MHDGRTDASSIIRIAEATAFFGSGSRERRLISQDRIFGLALARRGQHIQIARR
jgi:hypothetical protein